MKTRKVKALTAEVNMWRSMIQEYKGENQRLDDELQNIKKSLCQKRKEKQCREKNKAQVEQPLILPQISSRPRFTGGGFSLKK